MATFEEHIEGLTQIDIGTSTSPSTSDLTEMLKNSVVITVNNISLLQQQIAQLLLLKKVKYFL